MLEGIRDIQEAIQEAGVAKCLFHDKRINLMKANPFKYVYVKIRIRSGITGYRLDYRLWLQVMSYHLARVSALDCSSSDQYCDGFHPV